MGLHRTVPR